MLQGGAHLSFGMIPLNLLRGGQKADYLVTGNWAEKATKEAKLGLVFLDMSRAVTQIKKTL